MVDEQDDTESDLRGGIARPGLLTRSDREYLLGEKTYDDAQEERNARQRLRTRIRNALLDFHLLNDELAERDRRQIFSDIALQPHEDDEVRDAEMRGMVQTIAFLYAGAEDAGVPFETIVEYGVVDGAQQVLADPLLLDEVDVTIDVRTITATDAPIEKIASGAKLTDSEYHHLVRLLFVDRDQLLAQTAEIDLPRAERAAAGEQLTRGESLLLIARTMADPTTVDADRAGSILHDDVTQDLNLDPFLVDRS